MNPRARRIIELCFGLIVLGLWAVTLRPAALGGPVTYVVIRGDSMLPTYRSGDLLVLRSADAYASGDVVGYRVPAGEVGAGHLVVHRIAGGDPSAGLVMLGDNNPAPDPWLPRGRDVVGTAWLVAPGLGRLIAFIHQPAGAGALAVSLLVVLTLARGRPRAIPGARRASATAGVALPLSEPHR
jgi:signal peptidase